MFDIRPVNYRFNPAKATEIAARFIQKERDGRINVMKLIKLVYLLDRFSIARRGVPVVGGAYYSLRNGPVTSELLDVINSGRLADEADVSWEKFISDREDHQISLNGSPGCDHLADSEIQMADEVYAEHGSRDQWGLRDWCHNHCPEWTPVETGRERITVEDIALHVGHSPALAKFLRDEAAEANILAKALSIG